MVDRSALQNLSRFDKIVNPDGTPTEFFMRLLQGKNAFTGDIETSVANLLSIDVDTTAPIAGGPFAFADHEDGDPPLVISHDNSGVAAGSYTNADITVDERGHVTAAANGSGGGGGGGSWPEKTLVVPTASMFTFQNQGSASVTDEDNGLYLDAPGSGGDENRFLKFTAGAADFTNFVITTRAQMIESTSNSTQGAIILRNSSNGRLVIWGSYGPTPQDLVQNWNSYNSWSSNVYLAGRNAIAAHWPWRRIVVSGGNINFQYSSEGRRWISVGTVSVASFLGAIDEIGLGCTAQASNGGDSCFNHFEVA